MKRFFATVTFVALAQASASLATTQEQGAMVEWPHVGAGKAHTKFSSVEDITAANVGELEIVWQ